MWHQLHILLLKMGRMVEDYGYHAASFTSGFEKGQGFAGKLAEMAGLGRINDAGVFESPEFGIDAIVGAVTTDAVIDPTPRSGNFSPSSV